MKPVFSIFAVLFVTLTVWTQTVKPTQPDFDIEDFNRKFAVVEWLVEYDNVAWKTTDFVMALSRAELARLGEEWFCFQDRKKRWHAVYGKLAGDKYELVVHLIMDGDEKVVRTNEAIDQNFLNQHAQALKTGRDKLTLTIPAGSPRFNQFVRQNADKTFSVWLFPAFQPNRLAVYGGEAIYTIDSGGTKVLKDESYFQKDFRGFKSEPPREIWLNYRDTEKPTLGAIFFVWYYKSYFTQIFIDNAKSTSTAIKTPAGYLWTHVEKGEGSKAEPPKG